MANPSGALWNWFLDGLVAPGEVRAALAAVLARPVAPLDAAGQGSWPTGVGREPAQTAAAGLAVPDDAPILCDVWHADGDFATRIDCYLAPEEPAEVAVVAELARRLGRRCLVPDDTLDPGRFLLANPDGTLRPVHLDIADSDDGPVLSRLRPCTLAHQRLKERSVCRQSRWAPDTVVPGRAAA